MNLKKFTTLLENNDDLHFALQRAEALEPELSVRENEEKVIKEFFTPVAELLKTEKIEADATFWELCFYVIDLVRAVFKQDSAGISVRRDYGECVEWVSRHRPDWSNCVWVSREAEWAELTLGIISDLFFLESLADEDRLKRFLMDEPVDDFASGKGHTPVKNLLIVSLSTFAEANELRTSTCSYTMANSGPKTAQYYQQQEPFFISQFDRLKKSGEILLLVSPEARTRTAKVFSGKYGGKPVTISPLSYYVKAVEAYYSGKGAAAPAVKSVELDMSCPIGAISEVVSHLRDIKAANIYLGTNGGLRSNQLILEAILSLLKKEEIVVKPGNVLTVEYADHVAEVNQGSEEFRIFDFVSGINEFLKYGRAELLEKYYEGGSGEIPKLITLIKKIAASIRFNLVDDLETAILELRDYYNKGAVPTDPYLLMFHEAIRNDYGNLLTEEGLDPVEEINWCKEKGLYMQAYTIAETHMPKRFFERGWIVVRGMELSAPDDESKTIMEFLRKVANQHSDDPYLAFFNSIFLMQLQLDSKKHDKSYNDDDSEKVPPIWTQLQALTNGRDVDFGKKKNVHFRITVPKQYRDLIWYHFRAKQLRNKMCHPDIPRRSKPEDFERIMQDYYDELVYLYSLGSQINETIVIEYLGKDQSSSDGKKSEPTPKAPIAEPVGIQRKAAPAFQHTTPNAQKINDPNQAAIVLYTFSDDDCAALRQVSREAWSAAIKTVSSAKSSEYFTQNEANLQRAMPVFIATALRQMERGNRKDPRAVKFGKVMEYSDFSGKRKNGEITITPGGERKKLTEWFMQYLNTG